LNFEKVKRALIKDLHSAAQQRGAGYLEACLKLGRVSRDGQWVLFDDQSHAQLRAAFNPHRALFPSLPPGEGRGEGAGAGGLRLGDLVHKIAGPIGAALKWPCMKGDGTTDLKPNSPCDRARRRLNHYA
jgi:hypothetical protein